MTLTVAEIARRLGGALEGPGDAEIRRVAGIREAAPGDLTFLANPKYAASVATTRASAMLAAADWTGACPAALIRVADPSRAFAEAAMWLAPPPVPPPRGVHPSAVVSPEAALGRDVAVGPLAVIEAGARVGDRTVIGAQVYVGHGATIGSDCLFYPHSSAREYTRVGDRVIVHNGAVLGSDGFGYLREGTSWKKIPQRGVVVLEDDVEIGANVTVDRARFGETRICRGAKIDNLVQVAHNVVIGPDTAVAAQAGFAGSALVGARCQIGGQTGFAGHIHVGDDSVVSAQSGVHADVPPRSFMFGSPALPHRKAMAMHGALLRLPAMKARLAELEKRVRELESRLGGGSATA